MNKDESNEGIEQDVYLYQYDISNGYASKIVKFMTGRDFEAVWHTSLVIYGIEYFYGCGINLGRPKKTPYGLPIKESIFGKTKKTKKEFDEFLKSIDSDYAPEKYDFLKNNCNHFTNAICKFLCDKPLPDEILSQEQSIADTAFGKFIIEKLDAMSKAQMQAIPQAIEGQNFK